MDVKLSEPSNDWRKTSCIAWSDLRNIRRHFQWKTGLPVTAVRNIHINFDLNSCPHYQFSILLTIYSILYSILKYNNKFSKSTIFIFRKVRDKKILTERKYLIYNFIVTYILCHNKIIRSNNKCYIASKIWWKKIFFARFIFSNSITSFYLIAYLIPVGY